MSALHRSRRAHRRFQQYRQQSHTSRGTTKTTPMIAKSWPMMYSAWTIAVMVFPSCPNISPQSKRYLFAIDAGRRIRLQE